jgi:hypothetical protein
MCVKMPLREAHLTSIYVLGRAHGSGCKAIYLHLEATHFKVQQEIASIQVAWKNNTLPHIVHITQIVRAGSCKLWLLIWKAM